MKIIFALLVALTTLSGCTESAKQLSEATQTVDWYKEHGAERKTVLEKCNSNPGELAITPNCINAKSAQNQVDFGSRNFRIDATAPTFKR